MEKETHIPEDKLIDYIKGNLSKEDEKQVREWIAASEDNKRIVEQIYFICFAGDRINAMKGLDADKSFDSFWQQVEKKKRKETILKTFRFFRQAAAILFIPLAMLTAYLFTENVFDMPNIEIMSNPGTVSSLELPDGSKVWLNSKSKITYPAKFNSSKREVTLDGEAFFEVARNEQQPFIVKADNNYSVEVLGTTFNVTSFKEDPQIETTLISGLVKLHINGNSYLLNPHENSVYTKTTGNMEIEKVNAVNRSLWKEGKLIFRSTPMEEVLKVLERNFNVKFEVENRNVYQSVLTARFDNQQLHQILDFISLASGIEFEKQPMSDKTMEGATIIKVKIKKSK